MMQVSLYTLGTPIVSTTGGASDRRDRGYACQKFDGLFHADLAFLD